MIHLIDSAVILNDIQFSFSPEEEYLTTSLVIAEIKDFRSRAVVDNAFSHKLLRIGEPSQQAVGSVRQTGRSMGMRLSAADVSLIALALECRNKGKEVRVITDDYSVQNTLSFLGIPFSSVLRGEIKQGLRFEKICRGCGKKYKNSYVETTCGVCGSGLKRAKKAGLT